MRDEVKALIGMAAAVIAPFSAVAQAPQAVPSASAPMAAPTTAPALDPQRVAAARELMRVMRAEEQTRKGIDASMAAMMGGMAERVVAMMPRQPGITDDPEFKAIMQRFMDRVGGQTATQIKASMPQLIEGIVGLYARNFTVAQISDMTSFYRTPTGQAFVDKMPTITAQSATLTQQLLTPSLMASMGPAIEQVQSELKAWAAKHPEMKGSAK